MYVRAGRQIELGLGSWTGSGKAGRVLIPLARKKALALHDEIGSGVDTQAERRLAAATFGAVVEDFLAAKAGDWNAATAENWKLILTRHCSGVVGVAGRQGQLSRISCVCCARYWEEKARNGAARCAEGSRAVLDYAKAKRPVFRREPGGAGKAIWIIS